jgi:hypothetical protein
MPNAWHFDQPYWAFICRVHNCPWGGQEWRNQTGDPSCSMCGNPQRELVGRFQPIAASNGHKRLNLDTGESETLRTAAARSALYAPYGAPQVGVRDGAGMING